MKLWTLKTYEVDTPKNEIRIEETETDEIGKWVVMDTKTGRIVGTCEGSRMKAWYLSGLIEEAMSDQVLNHEAELHLYERVG